MPKPRIEFSWRIHNRLQRLVRLRKKKVPRVYLLKDQVMLVRHRKGYGFFGRKGRRLFEAACERHQIPENDLIRRTVQYF